MRKLYILALAALCALVGCNKNDETPVVPSKGGPVRFATNLNSYTVKSSLAENDQIGVFAGAPITRINVLGTVTSSKGVAFAAGSEICWQSGQTSPTTFAAYYPYSASCNATAADPFKFSFSLAADQSSAEGVAASDLLTAVAANVAVPADPAAADPVTLTFTHQGSKFVVNVTKEISAEIESVEILGTKLTGVVDMANKTVSDHSGDATAIIANRPNSGANTFEAIILPAADIAPQIKVTVAGGTTYTYSMEGTMTFVAGKQYTATVNIAANPVSADAVIFQIGDITDWDVVETPLSYGDNPVVVQGDCWGVIGLGGDWANDIPMSEIAPYCWSVDIDYVAGDQFKFRYAGSWDVQYGMWNNIDPAEYKTIEMSWIEATTSSNPTYGLADGSASKPNCNIALPEAGNYTLTLYSDTGSLYVTKN